MKKTNYSMIKTLHKLDITYLNIIKAIYDKPIYIIFNGEKLKAFRVRPETRRVHSHHSVQHNNRNVSQSRAVGN